MFGQGYTHVAPSFSMPNFGLASYTPECNGRTYTNTNGNYQALYSTIAYTDPIPLPGSSTRFLLNYAYNNATWYNTYGPSEHTDFGYETLSQFPFRPQPVEMTPARATAEPCADPNNLTTQLATILRESFGIEPKGHGTSIKNLTPTTMTKSRTLEDIESSNSQSLMGRMVKPHLSILVNLFYNVLKLVLMML
jgi:hypothetical protein